MKSIARRVSELEEREGILYGFMDDIRKWTLQLQGERREHRLRLRELETANAETREMTRAVNILHAESQKRIAQNEIEIGEIRKLSQAIHERVSRLEDRQDESKQS